MQEAIQKAGGTQALLDGAVRAGRVIKSGAGGMAMFYFPRRVYSKQTVLKSKLSVGEDKLPENDQAVEKFKDDIMQDSWDPYNLVAAGMDSIGASSGMPDVAPMSSLPPMASVSPMAPTSSKPTTFTPSIAAGMPLSTSLLHSLAMDWAKYEHLLEV